MTQSDVNSVQSQELWPRIGLMAGNDDPDWIEVSGKRAMRNTGSTDIYRLGGYSAKQAKPLAITKGYFRNAKRVAFDNFDVLINLVTDPEINGKVLKTIDQAIKGYRGPVLNAPRNVMLTTREHIARRMEGVEGLVVPRVRTVKSVKAPVIRALAEAGAIAFPAIVRKTGTHGGKVLGVARTPEDLEKIPSSHQAYTLTEFVDYSSHEALFRKYRVFYFGGTPVFRHQLISDRWNVHMADRARFMMDRPALVEESLDWYDKDMSGFPAKVRETLDAVYGRTGLDFCGIDFGIMRDGRVVLFEANATMNFFPVSDDPRLAAMHACLARAEAAFRSMVEAAAELRAPS